MGERIHVQIGSLIFAPMAERLFFKFLSMIKFKTGIIKLLKTGYLHKTNSGLQYNLHYGDYTLMIKVILQIIFQEIN